MDDDKKAIRKTITNILQSQRLAVLATVRNNQPYTSLMAYTHTSDLETVVVATSSATRKYSNLTMEPRVSLLIDTSGNCESDFHLAESLTLIGKAEKLSSEEESYRQLYLKRHPYLVDFVAAPTTVLFKVKVAHYLLVSRFQNVMEYHTGDEKDIFT